MTVSAADLASVTKTAIENNPGSTKHNGLGPSAKQQIKTSIGVQDILPSLDLNAAHGKSQS